MMHLTSFFRSSDRESSDTFSGNIFLWSRQILGILWVCPILSDLALGIKKSFLILSLKLLTFLANGGKLTCLILNHRF